MNLAGLLGALVGTMIDPLTWGSAIVGALVYRSRRWYWRFAGAIVLDAAFAAGIAFGLRQADPSAPRAAVLSICATAIWALLIAGGTAVLRKRG